MVRDHLPVFSNEILEERWANGQITWDTYKSLKASALFRGLDQRYEKKAASGTLSLAVMANTAGQ